MSVFILSAPHSSAPPSPAESDSLNRESSERFAAGYIQCMHEVHMFVSSCPGIDATVAAELLNHLLECMPLNEDHLQDVLTDLMADAPGGDSICGSLASPGGHSMSSSSILSSEDLCSDLDETDSEQNQSSGPEVPDSREVLSSSIVGYPRSMWRPW